MGRQKMQRKGNGEEKRGQTLKWYSTRHPIAGIVQLYNLSTFQPRRRRDSRCLPPRLLLDGNLKQEHPKTKGFP